MSEIDRGALPAIAYELPLSEHAFRLYAHLWRTANADGVCTASIRQLKDDCHFASHSRVIAAKRELEGAGLIAIEPFLNEARKQAHALRLHHAPPERDGAPGREIAGVRGEFDQGPARGRARIVEILRAAGMMSVAAHAQAESDSYRDVAWTLDFLERALASRHTRAMIVWRVLETALREALGRLDEIRRTEIAPAEREALEQLLREGVLREDDPLVRAHRTAPDD